MEYAFDGFNRLFVSVDSIPPNAAFENGDGLNFLTSAEPPAPYGGFAFHDNHVWIRGALRFLECAHGPTRPCGAGAALKADR